MKKTLGGERLGAGKKIKVDLHGWGRATFNQSKIWRSTMGVGTAVPCYKNIGLTGTTFEIDIKTLGHTIPAIAPCFGDFKFQVALFACPIRLYQGSLHNNAVNMGLEMSKVLFPKITIEKKGRTNTSSLLNYFNIRGVTNEVNEFNATPILAYYDIYKNYYANKQEEKAKVIGWRKNTNEDNIEQIIIKNSNGETPILYNQYPINNSFVFDRQAYNLRGGDKIIFVGKKNWGKIENFTLMTEDGENFGINPKFQPYGEIDRRNGGYILIDYATNLQIGNLQVIENEIIVSIFKSPSTDFGILLDVSFTNDVQKIDIIDFDLKNIDEARRKILQKSDLLDQVTINLDLNFYPYNLNINDDESPMFIKEMNGLCLTTYMSDIFNNWLNNTNVDLINEISSVTGEIDENGKPQFSMDALILAKKVYNLLNRIAVSGGTYEDWQESVYGQKAISRAESPIYIGGTSSMIQFEEVVSTAESENQALGTLGGRGIMTNRKNGKIIYKCNEPTLIIGIATITPRIDYYQGNDWFATEINSLDDLHKPELDGIGFQNLIANQVIWSESREKALAKQPAWLNYQTEINEVYGYFAEPETEDQYKSLGHMVLRRDYETDENGEITDFTTYIDPEKYNKIFASKELTDQNFWMQIGFDVKVRRVMAACEIPNL